MRLRRNNSLVSFIISQSHVKWEVFFNLFFTRQGWFHIHSPIIICRKSSLIGTASAAVAYLCLSDLLWSVPKSGSTPPDCGV